MTTLEQSEESKSVVELPPKRLTVISTANTRYFPGVLVTFYSLLCHLAPGWSVDLKLLTDDLDKNHHATLRRVIEAVGREHTLETIQVDLKEYDRHRADYGGSKLAYARLLMPEVVQANSALYVDSDIVVQRDVSRVATLPWEENKLLYAVQDPKIPTFSVEEMPHERLGIPGDAPYFNSGFLWVNLAAWRQQGIGDACRAYLRDFPDGVRWWDQSVLNAVLWNRWLPLDRRWNLPPERTLSRFGLWPSKQVKDVNIHYLGPEKPWLEMHPYQHFYRDHVRKIAARLSVDELTLPRQKLGAVYRRWHYFLNRGFWNYGSFCKQKLLRMIR